MGCFVSPVSSISIPSTSKDGAALNIHQLAASTQKNYCNDTQWHQIGLVDEHGATTASIRWTHEPPAVSHGNGYRQTREKACPPSCNGSYYPCDARRSSAARFRCLTAPCTEDSASALCSFMFTEGCWLAVLIISHRPRVSISTHLPWQPQPCFKMARE